MEAEKKEHEHHKHEQKSMPNKFNLYYAFVAITIILGILLIVNIFLASSINNELKKKTETAKQALKPAKIELALIKNSKCADCFDILNVVNHIKNANVNITKEIMLEFESNEGRALISKYSIQKVPTVVVTGEVEKTNIQGLVKRGDALVLADINPPYTNAANGQIEGRVTLYLLKDSECTKCNDLSTLILQIKAAGVKIYEEKSIEANSDEGKALISKYNIGFAPSLILSKDAGEYEIIQTAWQQVGSKANDGAYVLTTLYPPFINLTTNELKGIVNIIYLTDKSCTECYDVYRHREIITSPQSFAVILEKEETIDISDAKGKEIIAKYNITLVPATILSKEIEAYPTSKILSQFFSVEEDGSYVFRKLDSIGSYKDLTTNQVVQAQQDEQQ